MQSLKAPMEIFHRCILVLKRDISELEVYFIERTEDILALFKQLLLKKESTEKRKVGENQFQHLDFQIKYLAVDGKYDINGIKVI